MNVELTGDAGRPPTSVLPIKLASSATHRQWRVSTRALALWGLLVFAVLLGPAGCSRVELAYNTADLFIEYYADKNLALDREQLADWKPTLENALARHRRDELPYLAAFFDTAWQGTRRGLEERTVECLLEQSQTIYRQHARLIGASLAPLLAGATSEQLDRLERQFREDFAEAMREADAIDAQKKARKRAKRYADAVESWIGPLTAEQQRIVEDVARDIPDSAEHWDRYRYEKLSELIALLRKGASEADIRVFLDHWLVEQRDVPPALQRIKEGLRAGIAELLLRMDASLTAEQRERFAARLKSLRDDFMKLQPYPRMARVDCAGA